MVPRLISKKQQRQATVFNVLNKHLEVFPMISAPNTVIWKGPGSSRSSESRALPLPSLSSNWSHWELTLSPLTHQPNPIKDVCFFGLKLTRYHAIDITLWKHIYFSNFIDLTQRIFGLFEQNTKIHISRSMGRILTNKPLIER